MGVEQGRWAEFAGQGRIEVVVVEKIYQKVVIPLAAGKAEVGMVGEAEGRLVGMAKR